MYKRRKPENWVESLTSKGFKIDGILRGKYVDPATNEVTCEITDENDELYGDIEVNDFNKLFRNADLIEEQFGQSIKINVKLNRRTG